ncbi:MAG: TIGR03936 family radical SAM-associated protein [Thermoleophilia bacterium]
MNFNYQMRYSKTGRARFISHLDTLSCLVRALRRTGVELAFSQGMRPKPILSLAMPLGVGVEGEDEICDFSLKSRAPLTELAKQISRELPQGIELKSVGPTYDQAKAASRVDSCAYRIELRGPSATYEDAVNQYNAASELVLMRHRPKGDKEVDIKKYVERIDLLEGGNGISFDMKVTPEGTARPDEIITALSGFAVSELAPERVVRTGIRLTEEEQPRAPRPGGRPRPHGRRR